LKIVYASTPVQEEKIKNLVDYVYTSIFPLYFTDNEIRQFMDLNILNIQQKTELEGTLKESFQIISCLEILISLIESKKLYNQYYKNLFEKNVDILNNVGLSFPFTTKHFISNQNISNEAGSIYVKAANEWLI